MLRSMWVWPGGPTGPTPNLSFISIMPVQPVDGARFERNVFYNSKPDEARFFAVSVPQTSTVQARGVEVLAQMKIENNVYFNAAGAASKPPGLMEQMRVKGAGPHDVYEDPLFVDVEHGDFRFRSDSPVLKLGIKPIDLSDVGLTRKFPKRLLD